MSPFSVFALRATPFSPGRFALFIAGLVALCGLSLFGEGRVPSPASAGATGRAVEGAAEAAVVRFAQPIDDTAGDLRQVGLPWFLRRAGATATVETPNRGEVDIVVGYRGRVVGRYIERLAALGEGRSKLWVTFVAQDLSLVNELAASITTKLDPVALMRIVMAEHVRSSINGGGFDMNVLTESWGSRLSIFRKAFVDSGKCENPQRDDFAPCSQEEENASIRRAYRQGKL